MFLAQEKKKEAEAKKLAADADKKRKIEAGELKEKRSKKASEDDSPAPAAAAPKKVLSKLEKQLAGALPPTRAQRASPTARTAHSAALRSALRSAVEWAREEAEEKRKAAAAKKAAKDAEPKKNKSAYQWFCEANRPRVAEANAEATPAEVTALLGAEWKELAEEVKQEHVLKAEEDKERYVKECAEAGIEIKASKADKADDESKGPKKPTTPYFAYCAAQRASFKEQHPEAKVTELAKLMGAAWKELGAEEKAKYEAEAAADKERYAKECAEAGIELAAPKEKKEPKEKAEKGEGTTAYGQSGRLGGWRQSHGPPWAHLRQRLPRGRDPCRSPGPARHSPNPAAVSSRPSCAGKKAAKAPKDDEEAALLEALQATEAALQVADEALSAAAAKPQPKAHKEAFFYFKKEHRLGVAMENAAASVEEILELLQAQFDKCAAAPLRLASALPAALSTALSTALLHRPLRRPLRRPAHP